MAAVVDGLVVPAEAALVAMGSALPRFRSARIIHEIDAAYCKW